MVPIKVKRLAHAENIELPRQMTLGSSGADVCAANDIPFILEPGTHTLIPTGLCFEIPMGFEIQVRPRSGLAAKHGITILNAPGTIDADYRGEVKIILVNHGDNAFEIARGTRIAQLVVAEVPRMEFIEVEELEDSHRGTGGFGHTGHK